MAHIAPVAPATASPSVFTTHESSLIHQALSLIEQKRLRTAPVLYYFEDFERYLVLRFAGLANEQGHVLYLNINQELLAAETEFWGNQRSVTWDMRKVVLRAITLGAEYVVFAHNHPSERGTPSEEDIRHLTWSEDALRPLSIQLLDSYVVTSRGIVSIKHYRQHQAEVEARKRKLAEEMAARKRLEEYDRRRTERGDKIRAGRARKAAERAAQLQGATA